MSGSTSVSEIRTAGGLAALALTGVLFFCAVCGDAFAGRHTIRGSFPIPTDNANANGPLLQQQLVDLLNEISNSPARFAVRAECDSTGGQFADNDALYERGLLLPPRDPQFTAQISLYPPADCAAQRTQFSYSRIVLTEISKPMCEYLTGPGGFLAQNAISYRIIPNQVVSGLLSMGNSMNNQCIESGVGIFSAGLATRGYNNIHIFAWGSQYVVALDSDARATTPTPAPVPTPPPIPAPTPTPPPSAAAPGSTAVSDAACKVPAPTPGQRVCGVKDWWSSKWSACGSAGSSCSVELACRATVQRAFASPDIRPAMTNLQKYEVLQRLVASGPPPIAETGNIYKARPDILTSGPFWEAELARYRSAARKIQATVPLRLYWTGYNTAEREAYLREAARIFVNEFGMPMPRVKAYPSSAAPDGRDRSIWGSIAINFVFFWADSDGGAIPDANNEYVEEIFLLDVRVYDKRRVYRTLFEELVHARQRHITMNQRRCGTSFGSDEDVIAGIFDINLQNYFYLALSEEYAGDDSIYRQQPIEYWAKEAADEMLSAARIYF